MKKYSPVFIFILSIFLLCGCYDNKEIDETAYIIALGIDKSEKNGYDYTFQFSAPLATMSGEGSKGGDENEKNENSTVRNLVISAPDFYTAKNMTNNFLSKTVDMSHLKLIVFSAGVDSDGFLNHSQFMLREREVRPHTAVALSKTSAQSYLKSVNPQLEANTAKYYELMALRSNNVYSPTKRLSDFVDEISSALGVSVLPIAQSYASDSLGQRGSALVGIENSNIQSNNAELRGMAIFKEGKVQSLMSGKDAMIFNILTRSIKSCTITLKNPYLDNGFLTFRLNVPHAARYAFETKQKPCKILASQSLEINFFGASLPKGFLDNAELYDYAKRVLTDEVSAYFYRLSRTHRADIMKLGDHAKQSFLTEKEWKQYDWEKAFKSAEFKIEISFT